MSRSLAGDERCPGCFKTIHISNMNTRKLVVETLELSRGASKVLGMPKGGLGRI